MGEMEMGMGKGWGGDENGIGTGMRNEDRELGHG